MTLEIDQINQWIKHSVEESGNEWVVLTFRADGTVSNGSYIRQTLWSTSATYSIDKVNRALDWTITEERRKHKKRLGFVAWVGGDAKSGVQNHIHAALEIPAGCDKHEIVYRLNYLWSRNLKKLFKQEISSVIYIDEEHLVNAERYGTYCMRQEGSVRNGPADKLLMSRSLSL